MIQTRIILEMLGAPKEHIDKTLKDYIAKLKKDLKITKEHYEEPIQKDKLFTVFAELEITFKSFAEVFSFCFDSMPSSVEIFEPLEFKLSSQEMTDLLNDLQARLHETDYLVKGVRAFNQILDKNSLNVFQNFLLYAIRQGNKTTEELSKILGVDSKKIEPFISKLLERKLIKKEGDNYIPA